MADNDVFDLMRQALHQLLAAPLPPDCDGASDGQMARQMARGGVCSQPRLAHHLMAALIDKGMEGNVPAIKEVLALAAPAQDSAAPGVVEQLCLLRAQGLGWDEAAHE